LLKMLRMHVKDLSQATVAMESTGCYHINLFAFLCSEGIACAVINPLLITNFARLSLRKTKTDKKDALTIAQFLLAHRSKLSQVSYSQSSQDLKDLSRERESLAVMMAGLKNDVRRFLQLTFPELEHRCKLFTETMLRFLMKFPSARAIQMAKDKEIAKALIHGEGKRKRVWISAEEIIAMAKTSVAAQSVTTDWILSEKIETLLYLEEKKKRITEALVEACRSMRVDELDIITSVDGISTITGSTFLAELGDIELFRSSKHLIAFAGLDPSIHQSGQYEGISRISKRGNRHLRRVVFLMTLCAVRSQNVFREYFLRRKEEGLPPKKAILATAHKLLRVLFAMLSSKSYFRKGVVEV
ncbi:MAG: IS110 family transposase, partial [Deltaproteobacteria bacterium]